MHPYILTNSGQQVSKHSGAPTIEDIALSLSRMPRFGGHSRLPWTVIEHSLFVERMARAATGPEREALRLHALLHDAHEALTGDIPSPFKSLGMKVTQQMLDQNIASALLPNHKGFFMDAERHELIKSFDRRALLAEAQFVGPSILATAGAVEEHFGGTPHENDLALLARFRMEYPIGIPANQWLRAEFIHWFHYLTKQL